MVRKWADVVSFGHVTPLLRSAEHSMGVSHVACALEAVRSTGEAGVTGGILGALSGAGMLDIDGIPVDGAGGVVASIIGVLAAHHEVGKTLRTVGATSIGIFSFRKTEEWLGVRKASMHGESWNDDAGSIDTTGTTVGDEDPILRAAKAL
jgi:hypothetical protein